ncbi:hypothetical protein Mycch_1670 [Mycolicibacterium chubuense NBB4]|uniref:Secreted protein n=1 Tax=Mycolicibacterium chubuense (strain NBB4) TaxID=710421 RepID=I4BGQ5_MYCCN|nr:hypothetical protein [Mycolicibacterium chubuense]AFM16462.1 hypothetical protein Mycch_1670 [Mycolicibacterium chubuense NBB4]
MVSVKFARRHRRVATGMMTGILTTALVLAPPAAALHVEQYIEVPQCQPATSQVCPQSPEVRFTAGQNDRIQAQFTANANHCSDILVRFNVDNYPQSEWLRVGPGQTVTSPFFDRSGEHVLSVTAQGVEGGCNTGVLNAWGGTVRIDSVDVVGPAPHPVADSTPAPCSWRYSGGVVIDQDNGIRVDLDQWHDLTAMGPAHLYAPGSTVQSNRGEVIGAGGEGTNLSFTIVWYDKQGGHAETNDYTGSIDPQWGTLGGTTVNNAGVTNHWSAQEHWMCT